MGENRGVGTRENTWGRERCGKRERKRVRGKKKIEGNYSAMLNLAMEKELKGGSQEKKGLLKKSF